MPVSVHVEIPSLPPHADDFYNTLLNHFRRIYQHLDMPWRESDSVELKDAVANMLTAINNSPKVTSIELPIAMRALSVIVSRDVCPPTVSTTCRAEIHDQKHWCSSCIALHALEQVESMRQGRGE